MSENSIPAVDTSITSMSRLRRGAGPMLWQFWLGAKIVLFLVAVAVLLGVYFWATWKGWHWLQARSYESPEKSSPGGDAFANVMLVLMAVWTVYMAPVFFAIWLVVLGSEETDRKQSLLRARFGSFVATGKWIGLTFAGFMLKWLVDVLAKEREDSNRFLDDLSFTVVSVVMLVTIGSAWVFGSRLSDDLKSMARGARLFAADRGIEKIKPFFTHKWSQPLWFSDRSIAFLRAKAEQNIGGWATHGALAIGMFLALPVSIIVGIAVLSLFA